jgi:catechol 2,3-dioxygenase-like lactoylglutathione lyase family enzyme
MKQSLALIALLVNDYDKAIDFFVKKLHFILEEDTVMDEHKRWVVVAPPGSTGCKLLLAKAVNDEQRSRIGNQTGGRVFLFLHTHNFDSDFKNLLIMSRLSAGHQKKCTARLLCLKTCMATVGI